MTDTMPLNHNDVLLVEEKQAIFPINEIQGRVAEGKLPEILFITSCPPRECGIANYSSDLIMALNEKFNQSFRISICPVESKNEKHTYAEEIKNILNVDCRESFIKLTKFINDNAAIRIVIIQHEFGIFKNSEDGFRQFLNAVTKPVVIAFHTVLPRPDESLKAKVLQVSQGRRQPLQSSV